MQNNYFCIAAYDVHSGKLARPLGINGANWVFDEFQPPIRPGQLMEVSASSIPRGIYPHRTEDMPIKGSMQELETWTDEELYKAMLPSASDSISKVFGKRLEEDRYFIEGVHCPSLGGVRIARRQVEFRVNSRNRLRIYIVDNDSILYTLSVTCDRLRTLFDPEGGKYGVLEANRWMQTIPPDEPVILRVGLTRGYAGEQGEFNPKRCYLQVNGLLSSHTMKDC